MSLRDTWTRLDAAQRTRPFKLIATAAVVAVMLVLSIGAVVRANSPVGPAASQSIGQAEAEAGPVADETITNTDAAQRMLSGVLRPTQNTTGFVLSVLVVGAVVLGIVWLGLLLTYTGIVLVSAGVIVPLALFESSRSFATLIGGISSLALSFTVLLRVMQTAYSGSNPVLAIARNVLSEAVRLKLSIVFIALLIFGLAALPGLLDPEQPLRYRVQSFMQYGTGGTFWLIALLVVAFSVSTVATEQRDKIIWQTITKPVSAWEYILGKWLGVSSLAALLLAVNACGVFLFVEYLRQQPALGEREAFVAQAESGVSEDRLILETQILTAQKTVYAAEPVPSIEDITTIIETRVAEIRQRDPAFEFGQEQFNEWAEDLFDKYRLLYFAVPPGQAQVYTFENTGLDPQSDAPITLRYRIDAGSNRPDEQYMLSFSIGGSLPVVRESGLGHSHSMPLTPSILMPPMGGSPIPSLIVSDEPIFSEIMAGIERGTVTEFEPITAGSLVRENGAIEIQVINGEVLFRVDERSGRVTDTAIAPNPDPIRFPSKSLSISYPVGSYHLNFIKAVFVLWLKLAFLAMLGVTAATFLSFSVATLVAFGVFLIAEATPFISDSLDVYSAVDDDNKLNVFKGAIKLIAHGVSWIFTTYASLAPVEKLVDGENVSLRTLVSGLGLIAVWTGGLYLLAVLIFRRRELAIYSGQ